jgi:hypothetical protein
MVTGENMAAIASVANMEKSRRALFTEDLEGGSESKTRVSN